MPCPAWVERGQQQHWQRIAADGLECKRLTGSAFSHFEPDDKARIVVATLDLSRRWNPHWWGRPMRSAPGGRCLRQSLIRPLEADITREAQRWWTKP